MPGKKNVQRILTNTAVFILMEIAALHFLSDNATCQKFFLMKGIHAIQAKLWGGTEGVKYYFSLKKAYKELEEKNFELSQRLRLRREEDGMEKAGLDSIGASVPKQIGDFLFIPANVVKVSRNKQHNYLILGQGREDGVDEGAGIVTTDGVVGIVHAVSPNFSYAISFHNNNFSVSARLGREGAVGPLSWDGLHADGAILRNIPLQNEFESGDTVYTSGFSSIFPSDIPLGVTGNSKIVNGATYEIKVKLFQDPGAVRFVAVANNTGRQEIEELERIGGGGK